MQASGSTIHPLACPYCHTACTVHGAGDELVLHRCACGWAYLEPASRARMRETMATGGGLPLKVASHLRSA